MNENFKKGVNIAAGATVVSVMVTGVMGAIAWGYGKYQEEKYKVMKAERELEFTKAEIRGTRESLENAEEMNKELVDKIRVRDKKLESITNKKE